MPHQEIAPYGSWKSPITSDLIVADSIGLSEVVLDGDDVYWLELRPAEGGRNVLVRRSPDGRAVDVTPAPFNVRTRVHEYGGGSYFVSDGVLFFSNFADQRLHRLDPGGEPRPVTPEASLLFADGILDRRRDRIICVQEDRTTSVRDAINTLVSIDAEGNEDIRELAAGHDFYASPRLSPDGSRLAWLTWDHPNMPWNGTELWVAAVNADGSLGPESLVAGGSDESIFQPEWSPDGTLYFASDRTDWWNLYRWRDGRIEPVTEMPAEFGVPQWVFGQSTYTFESADRIICAYTQDGTWYLASLNTDSLDVTRIDLPYTHISSMRAASGQAFFRAGSPTEPAGIVQLDLASGQTTLLQQSSKLEIVSGYLSEPEPIEFPTEGGLTAHAFFYAPKNRDYTVPAGELPPLLVKSHGGPTGVATSALNLGIQYWTSRGIAVLDVNYGGSVGYGRAYRERLEGQWGIVDVDDCTNGARYLAEGGRVDGQRLIITGGSAGGYTTLCALTFRDQFSAGASHFGVADPEALAIDTHKFESRYLDRLIGPYPEHRDEYLARSPIHHTEMLSRPIIFFQGLEDQIVPPNQAEKMVAALRAKGVPVAYLPFAGEQHGFRRAENIKRTLDAELYFYSRVLGFELADPVEPVEIENL